MEEQGIGRPYAPTVSTILDREYVVKKAGLPPHHQPGPCGDRPDERAVLRHRESGNHRQYGTAADSWRRERPPGRTCCGSSTGTLSRTWRTPKRLWTAPAVKVPTRSARRSTGVQAESGGKVRPVRFLGLSRLPRVHVHHAAGGGDAGPLPKCSRRLMKRTGNTRRPVSSILLLYEACEQQRTRRRSATS